MEQGIRKNSRIRWLDIAKGLGMLLVIWGHIRETGISNAMVYAFHMPLFFFLSGVVFQKEKFATFGAFLKRRAKTLLLPYVVYSVLTWCIWTAYNLLLHNPVESYFAPLLQTVLSQGSGGYLVHNSPLWFVTCLFVVECIYYFTGKLPLPLNAAVCVLCAVLGNFMIREGSPLRHLPWSLDMALCALPFYALGNLARVGGTLEKLLQTVEKRKVIAVLVVAASVVLLFFGARWNGPVSMGHRKLNMVYVFYPLALVGILGTIVFSKLLDMLPGKALTPLQWFGEKSFRVMAVQTPTKGVVLVLLARIVHRSVGELSDSTLYSLAAFAVTLLLVVLEVFVITKIVDAIRKRKRKHI